MSTLRFWSSVPLTFCIVYLPHPVFLCTVVWLLRASVMTYLGHHRDLISLYYYGSCRMEAIWPYIFTVYPTVMMFVVYLRFVAWRRR